MAPVKPQAPESDIAGLLRHAVEPHQHGRLDEAEQLYRQALAAQPDNFDALHLYGVLMHQRGQPAEALSLIGKALRVNPRAAHAHSNYGLVLSAVERYSDALDSYDRAIALAPNYAEALNNRGNVLRKLCRAQEALESFERALLVRPNYPEAHNNRGNALAALGRFAEALPSYERALTERPDYADAHVNRADALRRLGRHEEALADLDRALALQPRHLAALKTRARLHTAIGHVAHALADYQRLVAVAPDDAEDAIERGNIHYGRRYYHEALADYDRAVTLKPVFALAHNNRGNTLRELGCFADALAAFDRALAFDPHYADAFNNRGNALIELNRAVEALADYDRAIALKPDFAFAHVNRGNALRYLGRADEALESFDRAIALAPDLADAHWNRALLCLAQGDFERGWPGYEWRWKRGIEAPRDFDRPQWQGEDLCGKTILLHAEQGFGDNIQMLRYLPLVAARAEHVLLELPDALIPLVAAADKLSVFVRGAQLPAFDLHCPLMSLPLAFSTRSDTIPAAVPYLHAPAERLVTWQARFAETPLPRVGLVWSGKPSHKNDHNRSISLARLAPLLSIAGVRFVSLQREYRDDDLTALACAPVVRLDDGLTDFADTAAVISKLDLVIAVDTAVAHLAGALGKPVWILLSHVQDWRWLADREDSPWYPTARLFRQTNSGYWDDVIARLVKALTKLTQARRLGAGCSRANFPPD